jgi:hypothetical protein
MAHYRVSYFKNLLSSDGHLFKSLQQQFDFPNVENAEEAAETAARQFERMHGKYGLRLSVDAIQVERVVHEHIRSRDDVA